MAAEVVVRQMFGSVLSIIGFIFKSRLGALAAPAQLFNACWPSLHTFLLDSAGRLPISWASAILLSTIRHHEVFTSSGRNGPPHSPDGLKYLANAQDPPVSRVLQSAGLGATSRRGMADGDVLILKHWTWSS